MSTDSDSDLSVTTEWLFYRVVMTSNVLTRITPKIFLTVLDLENGLCLYGLQTNSKVNYLWPKCYRNRHFGQKLIRRINTAIRKHQLSSNATFNNHRLRRVETKVIQRYLVMDRN